jgi:hypothetical protein
VRLATEIEAMERANMELERANQGAAARFCSLSGPRQLWAILRYGNAAGWIRANRHVLDK